MMKDKPLQVEKYLVGEENSHEDSSELNVSKAFRILECNTLAKKWNYKSQYSKMLHLTHQDKNSLAKTEDFQRIREAGYFLDSYKGKLEAIFSYLTIEVFLIWIFLIFLKKFLNKRRKKKTSEKTPGGFLQTSTGNKRILDLIISSLIFFVGEFSLLYWILFLQKSLGRNP